MPGHLRKRIVALTDGATETVSPMRTRSRGA